MSHTSIESADANCFKYILNTFLHLQYAEKRFVFRNKNHERAINVSHKIWNAVESNDKHAVYGLIVCFDADVNTTYEEGTLTNEVVEPELISSSGSSSPKNSHSSTDVVYENIIPNLEKASLSISTLDLSKYGWTLLHLACYGDDLGMIELLLQYGSHINACDSLGRTPLHHCILHRRNTIAKLLLTRYFLIYLCIYVCDTTYFWGKTPIY